MDRWAFLGVAGFGRDGRLETAGFDRRQHGLATRAARARLGLGDKSAEVSVSIAGQSVSAKADDQGRWKVSLAKLETGGPHELTIKAGDETRTLKNILVGEVWICSGQSNMEMGVGVAKDAKSEIAAANFPKIRLFTVEKHNSAGPARRLQGQLPVGRVHDPSKRQHERSDGYTRLRPSDYSIR